jgi:hypothetical protein
MVATAIPPVKETIMSAKIVSRILTTKTLIRVAFAILSLSGIAQASPDNHAAQQKSGGPYNFMAGGGG